MKVKVQGTLASKETQEFDFESQQTVKDVREEVAAIEGPNPAEFSLARGRDALQDSKTLHSLGIREGDTLSTLPRDARRGYDAARVGRLRIRDELQRTQNTSANLTRISENELLGRFQGKGRWRSQLLEAHYFLPAN